VVCAIACTLVFLILTAMVASGRLLATDTAGILAVRQFASPALTMVMLAASLVAHGKLAIPLAVLLAVVIYRANGRDDALLYVGACLLGEAVHLAIKAVVRHHRPVGISPKLTDAGWYSYPSGHEMLAVIIFGLGAVLVSRWASRTVRVTAIAGAAVIIVLVGISRVYLGAHWPSDVIGALFAGLAWSAACLAWAGRHSTRGTALRAATDTQRPYSAA